MFVISVVDANYFPKVKIYHNSTIVSSGSTTNRGGLAYATLDVNQNDTIFINYSSDGGTESISLLIYEIPDTAIDIVDTTAANTSYTAPSDGYFVITCGGASSGNYPGCFGVPININDSRVCASSTGAGYGACCKYLYLREGDVVNFSASSTNIHIMKTIARFIPD